MSGKENKRRKAQQQSTELESRKQLVESRNSYLTLVTGRLVDSTLMDGLLSSKKVVELAVAEDVKIFASDELSPPLPISEVEARVVRDLPGKRSAYLGDVVTLEKHVYPGRSIHEPNIFQSEVGLLAYLLVASLEHQGITEELAFVLPDMPSYREASGSGLQEKVEQYELFLDQYEVVGATMRALHHIG